MRVFVILAFVVFLASFVTAQTPVACPTCPTCPTCQYGLAARLPDPLFNPDTCQNMSGKVVVVTGVSSDIGIGRATALKFASLGAKVVGCARTKKNQVVNLAELEAAGVDYRRCDVREQSSMKQLADYVEDKHGQVDFLLSVAGKGYFGWADEDCIGGIRRDLWETNAQGLYNLETAFNRLLKTDNTSKIVVITSMGSEIAVPFQGPYIDSKHYLKSTVSSWGLEKRRRPNKNIDIIELMPSTVATNYMKNLVRAPCERCPYIIEGAINRTLELFANSQNASNVAQAVYESTCSVGLSSTSRYAVVKDAADYGGYMFFAGLRLKASAPAVWNSTLVLFAGGLSDPLQECNE